MAALDLQAFYQRDMAAILADPALAEAHAALLQALETGAARAAQRDADGVWQANFWVKTAILAGFKSTATALVPGWPSPSYDRTAFPPRSFNLADGVRMVPGGSSVRRGAYLAPGVVIMPPAYVNVGAFVDEGTMVDSHALVGSCAQIGKRVHLSAAAQVGGVLEPAGALPVVVEDDAFVGGLCGLFEGVIVRRRAVLAPGVVLSASTRIYDLVQGRELTREVPEGAVVVPGSRPASGAFAQGRGLCLAAPCIVKYRDGSTDAATTLEEALR
jgi:2,3,4,5-tetrahydropyridine-2-carboxylate N-succinyltransferase